MSCVPYYISAGGLLCFLLLASTLRFMCSMFCDRLANFALYAEPPSLFELRRRLSNRFIVFVHALPRLGNVDAHPPDILGLPLLHRSLITHIDQGNHAHACRVSSKIDSEPTVNTQQHRVNQCQQAAHASPCATSLHTKQSSQHAVRSRPSAEDDPKL